MNYFLLALALAAGLIALVYTANIVRVAFGQVTFNSGFAAIVHFILAPTAAVFAVWLFQIAVAK